MEFPYDIIDVNAPLDNRNKYLTHKNKSWLFILSPRMSKKMKNSKATVFGGLIGILYARITRMVFFSLNFFKEPTGTKI